MKDSWIAYFSLHRPVTVGMFFLLSLVIGSISYFKIPLQLLPSGFTRPSLFIQIAYSGGAPEEIVQRIAEPLEGVLGTISGVKSFRSEASGSRLNMDVTFQEGMDMEFAYREVQDRIERVRPQFPPEVRLRDIFVFKRSTDDIPVAAIAISYPKDMKGLDRLIEIHIKGRLSRMEGVANVEVFGLSSYQIFVDLNYQRVKSSGVPVYQLIQNFRASTVSLPSGSAYEGKKKLYIRTLCRFESLKEIENLPVTARIPLKELAEIKMAMPAPPFLATLEGEPSILMLIYKESQANTVHVCDSIEKFLQENTVPQLKSHLIFSQGTFIKNSLEDLQYTALTGGFFAMVILFVFLRKISLTILITLAVPASLVLTIITMYFIGQSLNIISLMGIMLAIGMLVDNSVVVVESIVRQTELGIPPKESALAGTSQVSNAILISTLTTVVVFVPFFVVESAFKFWLKEMGLPICISLLASLLVALILVPLVSSKILKSRALSVEESYSWGSRAYGKILQIGLRNRFESFLLVFLLFLSAYYPFIHLPQTDRVQGHSGSARISLRFPGSKSLLDASQRVAQFENILKKHKKDLGVESIRTFFSVQRGSITLNLPTNEKPRLGPTEFFEKLKEVMPRVPGVVANIQGESDSTSPEVRVSVVGKDSQILYSIARKVQKEVETMKGVIEVGIDVEKDSEEIHGFIRKDLSEKFQISPQMVADTIRYTLNGAPLPAAVINNREVDLQVGLREEDRENLSLLKRVEIKSLDGKESNLANLVDFKVKRSLEKIVRENKRNQITLTITLGAEHLMTFQQELFKKLEKIPLPEGYGFERGSRFEEFQELQKTGFFALSLDIIFVFLLMGVLFESFLLPLCVMISIPFAFMGVFWSLYLTNTPLETMSIIGMVLLVGVVVNNAIVLIDRINQLKDLPQEEAIMQAGKERLRPILITALTTIFGLLPMALGDSNIVGRPYYPMGRAVMGGLVASTILTLFVVPLLYTVLMDLQGKIKDLLGLK